MKKILVFIISAATLLVSCGNLIQKSGKSGKEGTYLVIGSTSLQKNKSRTVQTKAAQYYLNALTDLELTGTRSGGTEITLATANSLQELTGTTQNPNRIAIQTGTWNFKLDAKLEGVDFSATAQSVQIIKDQTNTISFVLEAVEKFGGMDILVEFEESNVSVSKVQAVLKTVDTNTQVATKTFLPADFEEVLNSSNVKIADSVRFTLDISDEDERIEKGTYALDFNFYVAGTKDEPIETIPCIVRVSDGITTKNDSAISVKLNEIYTITYNYNDSDTSPASLADGQVQPAKYSRKNTAITLPELERDGYVFTGWHKGSIQSDVIQTIPSGSYGNITLYASWQKQSAVSGSLVKDNRILNISINDDKNKLYKNTKLIFYVTDANGNRVTSTSANPLTFTAKILNKGEDVNSNTNNTQYYSVSNNVLTMNSANPLPSSGNYQVYVTVSQKVNSSNSELAVSSKVFDIEGVYDSLELQESKIALYKNNSTNTSSVLYNTYLVDSDSVSSANLSTSSLQGIVTAFDIDGNVYTIKNNTIYSNNSHFGTTGVSLSEQLESYSDFYGFTIDTKQNVAYSYGRNENSLYFYKYPTLISNGTASDPDNFYVSISNFTAYKVAIDDNILYILGDYLDSEGVWSYQIKTFNISNLSSGSSPDVVKNCNLDALLNEELPFVVYNQTSSSNPYCDMFAMDGSVYVLAKQNSIKRNSSYQWTASNKNIYSRGALIKWTPNTALDEATATDVDFIGFTNNSITPTSIAQMYLYYDGAPLYANSARTIIKTMDGSEHSAADTFFPSVFATSEITDSFAFASPSKIIAIKPKKLVIADDGFAFYVDADHGLSYKNSNRVVTVDLQDFVIQNVQKTNTTFDFDITEYIRSNISIDAVRNGGTYYDDGADVWYYDSSGGDWCSGDFGDGVSLTYCYIGIKESDD